MKDHKFIVLERIIKTGAVNFGRNIWLAVAAIAMMGITLTILLFAIVANATFNHSIADFNKKINVSVYLKDTVTTDERDQLIGKLKGIDNVESVRYVNKTESLAEYRQQYAGNKLALEAVSDVDNPLPAHLVIQPRDPNRLQPLKDFIEKPETKRLQSDPTSYSGDLKDAIDNIAKATHYFKQAGLIGLGVFIIISILIIFNTIRMTIFNRRDELIIMRLLGAGPWYIRGPFVVETMLYGVAAALISVGVCAALFAVASSVLKASTFGLLDITFSSRYFSSHFWLVLVGQVGAGIIIGALSSIFATRRYLKLR